MGSSNRSSLCVPPGKSGSTAETSSRLVGILPPSVRLEHYEAMTKYLITFPSEAMVLTAEEFPIVVAESHAVVAEAKAAGVWVFGGGIDEQVDPVLVAADGSVSTEIYPGSELRGGFTVLELPTREEAVEWARKIAVACRCAQELREFMYDPES